VQHVFLELLQESAARTVHDALRYAGRAGGVQDEHGMIERQLLEGQRRATSAEVAERDGAARQRRFLTQHGNEHDTLDARNTLLHGLHCRQAIDHLAGVTITVRGEQHLRRDLPEAVDHAACAEVG
jgi:hypothetical protein